MRSITRAHVVTSGSRAGFSLIELSVGLVIGGMAVTAAAVLLIELSNRAEAITVAAAAADRDANSERVLRRLIASVEPAQGAAAFAGDRESVSLRTWCETAAGWSEPCRIQLSFQQRESGRALVLQGQNGVPGTGIVLRHVSPAALFLYLFDAAAGGSWSESWAAITPPAAVGIVFDGDTLILPLR